MENELNSWALDFEDTLYSLLKSYMESKVKGIKVTQDEELTKQRQSMQFDRHFKLQ